jgi:hypothetical protein
MSNQNLPASVTNIATAIARSVSSVGATAGADQYAGMNKYGVHYFGAERVPIDEDSDWLVNLASGIQHGWVAWGSKERGNPGQNLGEILVPMAQPIPLESELPAVNGDWSKCVQIQMRCLTPEHEGVQILWKTNSYGGRKEYTALMNAVAERVQSGTTDILPLISLSSDEYEHKTYGLIKTPVFNIVAWYPVDYNPEETDAEDAIEAKSEPEPEPEPDPEPPRRRRRRKEAA